jgi:P-type Cu+ transporter
MSANPENKTVLNVGGMTCNNCVRHVTEAVQSVPGVHSAVVSLETRRASVRWTPESQKNISAVVQAIQKAGYEAQLVESDEHPHDHSEHKLAGWQLNLWIGVLGTAPLMIGEWMFSLGTTPWFQWFAFALAGAVQIFAGAQFYRGAWNQLKAGQSNMDTLVVLGSTTAFAYSTWALFSGRGGHVFFMEAAAIITLISVGHWAESRVSARASSAVRELLNLAPQTARRIVSRSRRSKEAPAQFDIRHSSFKIENSLLTPAASTEEEVPVAELKINDLVALRPGDRVPTDGEVVEGDSAVNEAMLTGESVPVDKTAQSRLFAGTVNLNGRLVMRVTATGEATALAHIIAAVQRAQSSRANIQRLGDRVSNVFVPIVVGIAILAGLWWGLAPESAQQVHGWLAQFLPWHSQVFDNPFAAAFITAAAVLIIACPCAMGLATPAAIMAGANAAARRGILIRDGVALEKAGEVTAVIFDKTGTLTRGKPEVAAIGAPNSSSACFESVAIRADQEIGAPHALAAALARHSTHPISQAVAKLSAVDVQISDWQEIRGSGVSANIQYPTSNLQPPTSKAQLGALRWLQESGVDFSGAEKFVAEWSGQGATIVGLAVEKSLLGLFAVKDTVKPGAAKVIEQLHRQRLKSFLVTGDNSLTAMSIAKQLGLKPENVFAEVRPEQKAEFVKKLQQQGERVAFVGDGINDAPALEQADLGIAVSRASDVARESADIILLKSEIEAVPESLGLARATLRTIKQNLFWAFFYNALGVPLAALGFMSPILCAAAMGVSDIVVIGNALRLSRWRSSD